MTRDQIDAAIARHAETEALYDQPHEDNKRVRVAGPFTVESLSPHRTISVEEKQKRAEVGHAPTGLKIQVVGPDKFGLMILDNLRKAGVQNTKKNQRSSSTRWSPTPESGFTARGVSPKATVASAAPPFVSARSLAPWAPR